MTATVRFNKILIANRGEIAVRAVRACREAGIRSVAVYVPADRDALAVRLADEAYPIDGHHDIAAYLDIDQLVALARRHGVDAVYPGYGFLSENAAFAAACASAGLVFIGPTAAVLEQLGDKIRAKALAEAAGLPTLPSRTLDADTADAAVAPIAAAMGWPVLVKAAAGGGGRGIRIAENPDQLTRALDAARREAQLSFGDNRVYLERYLPEVRHVEFQVLADAHGNVVHLGERECSIQRRFQKILEEAPCTAIPEATRARFGALSADLIRRVGLTGVATVEYLLTPDGDLYFIEVNPRIQVEHGITELITGVDLVRWQIRVAAGETLDFAQADVGWRGHAIQCRINAEAGGSGRAGAGVIGQYLPPGGIGVRVCSGVYAGQRVHPQFDPLLAKVMTHADDRAAAIGRMARALREYVFTGVETNIGLHQAILTDPDFRDGRLSTHYLARLRPEAAIAEAEGLTLPDPGGTALTRREIAVLAGSLYDSFKKTFRQSGQSGWKQQARREQLKS
jgi:acetyl-CoA carboxylase biotin carboxylase subunit